MRVVTAMFLFAHSGLKAGPTRSLHVFRKTVQLGLRSDDRSPSRLAAYQKGLQQFASTMVAKGDSVLFRATAAAVTGKRSTPPINEAAQSVEPWSPRGSVNCAPAPQ